MSKPALLFSGSPWDDNIAEFFTTAYMAWWQTAVLSGLLDPGVLLVRGCVYSSWNMVHCALGPGGRLLSCLACWILDAVSVAQCGTMLWKPWRGCGGVGDGWLLAACCHVWPAWP